jgi:hypothetical protein
MIRKIIGINASSMVGGLISLLDLVVSSSMSHLRIKATFDLAVK